MKRLLRTEQPSEIQSFQMTLAKASPSHERSLRLESYGENQCTLLRHDRYSNTGLYSGACHIMFAGPWIMSVDQGINDQIEV